jgi:hypothetical protein
MITVLHFTVITGGFRGTETVVTSLMTTKFREQNHLNNEAISWHAMLFKWAEFEISFQETIMYRNYYWKYLN